MWSLYPLSGVSRGLLVLLSRMIPPPVSLPNMELQRGVPALLERPEVKHDVWLDPGMLRGEGASDDRCWRIRFKFFTVWNTRFGCSLETNMMKYDIDHEYFSRSLNQQTCLLIVPLLLYVRVIHLKLLPHGALYFCCQRVLEGNTKMGKCSL